jgi:hypothetical protein
MLFPIARQMQPQVGRHIPTARRHRHAMFDEGDQPARHNHPGEWHLLETQVPYQASVMNRFEPTSSAMGSRRGEASVAAHAPALP